MSYIPFRAGLILCLMLCGLAVRAVAQQPQLAPEKRALIRELLDAADVAKTAEAVMDAMLSQAERSSQQTISEIVVGRGNTNPQEQEELRQKMTAMSVRMTKRFKELMAQRVDLPQVLEEIFYAIYDRYFTEGEIKDLIAFYRSPTGKKSIAVMPKLFADSMTRTAEALTPKIQQIMKEITDEELKNIEAKSSTSGEGGPRPRR